MRFDTGAFLDSSMIPESKAIWLPVNTQTVDSIPFKVIQTELSLQDRMLNFDSLTELTNRKPVFETYQLPARSYEKRDGTVMDICIEMDLNLKTV